MTVYTRPRQTVARLLTKWGGEMTMTKVSNGAYDPSTGASAQTTATHTGTAFREFYALRDIDGTLIQRGDVRLLVSPTYNGADIPAPVKGDTILYDGTTYKVIGNDPLKPADEAVMYSVQARGV